MGIVFGGKGKQRQVSVEETGDCRRRDGKHARSPNMCGPYVTINSKQEPSKLEFNPLRSTKL